MRLRSIRSAPLKDKRVLLRLELNVPLDKGRIKDATRIAAALPTIRFLLEKKVRRIIIIAHLGRPGGKRVPALSLKPVARELERRLRRKVVFVAEDPSRIAESPKGRVVLLENIRFYPGEKKDSVKLARSLARLGDLYCDDAFGAMHRRHASVHALAKELPAYAGLLVEEEVKGLSQVRQPKRPFVAMLGGGKADKLETVSKLARKADRVLLAGVSGNMVLAARGYDIGVSKSDASLSPLAKRVARLKLELPVDVLVASRPGGRPSLVPIDQIPEDKMIVDIGPRTISCFIKGFAGAKTIYWNGPVGYIEYVSSLKGTAALLRALAKRPAKVVLGGGDLAYALKRCKIPKSRFAHVSTGGGASLRFVEGETLPGLEVLRR